MGCEVLVKVYIISVGMKVALDVYAINIRTISNIKQVTVWISCQDKLIVILLIGRARIPACKSITPTRIEIIEINRLCPVECYGNRTRCGCDRGEKRTILLENDFHCSSLNWSTSQYTNHIACVLRIYSISPLLSPERLSCLSFAVAAKSTTASPHRRIERVRIETQNKLYINSISNKQYEYQKRIFIYAPHTDFTQILFNFA